MTLPEVELTAPQCSLSHQLLPPNEQTKAEEVVAFPAARDHACLTHPAWQDNLYLSPIIQEIEAEMKEKQELDIMMPNKKHKTAEA